MKIAIHHSNESYSPHWIQYCKENKIDYKIVSCYDSDIIEQVSDCDAVLWHHNHVYPTDFLIAKQILYSLEMAGKLVYPNWQTGWHFDDKLGQKYLFEALDLPHVKYHVFYNKKTAKQWLKSSTYPVVFKLRGGAGSSNVRLLRNYSSALKIVNKVFSKGIRQFNSLDKIKDTIRLMKLKKASLKDLAKAVAHIVVPIKLEHSRGREKGYVLFQEFVPNLSSDIRVQVIGNKCYAMERFVRENDFRASGSGKIDYDGSKISKDLIKLSFEIAEKIQVQTIAFDFVKDQEEYKLIEVSYCWGVADGELDPGYWDSDLNWHSGTINPFAWMVEDVVNTSKLRK
jgi:glutathione synthase/RimK-type ligase-like ATP-grasp enzyme